MIVVMLTTLVAGTALLYKKPVNVLVFGTDGARSDTMMLLMLKPASKSAHVISFPRDTYFVTSGKTKLGQSKLNAVYAFKDVGGVDGLKKAIESLAGVTIDYYVRVDYDAVAAVVDLIGGVTVEVPFDMKYADPTAKPPLVINIKAGEQTLKGDDALGFLRFRQSSDGKIREGDIQRIARQQQFISQAIKKSLSWRLPIVVHGALQYVDTDLGLLQGAQYAAAMLGLTTETLYFHTLPPERVGRGKDGLSYYFHDEKATQTLMKTILNDTFEAKDEK